MLDGVFDKKDVNHLNSSMDHSQCCHYVYMWPMSSVWTTLIYESYSLLIQGVYKILLLLQRQLMRYLKEVCFILISVYESFYSNCCLHKAYIKNALCRVLCILEIVNAFKKANR